MNVTVADNSKFRKNGMWEYVVVVLLNSGKSSAHEMANTTFLYCILIGFNL